MWVNKNKRVFYVLVFYYKKKIVLMIFVVNVVKCFVKNNR